MKTPLLSIVTGTLDRPDSLVRLILSVKANTSVPYELIVSDASECQSGQPVDKALLKGVKIIKEQPRLGFAKGYNQALAHARGTWVIWLNDDCEVLPCYAAAAIAFMECHPEIGLGAIHYREGTKDFHVNSYFGMLYANFGIMSRTLGNELGWFDEDLPMYGNDNALAFKVLLAGRGVAGIQEARIIHHAVHDNHRVTNNEQHRRKRDVERLVEKYGKDIDRIRAVYEHTKCAGSSGRDQTPNWVKAMAQQ